MPALAWGTIRIPCARVTSTTAATTIKTIRVAKSPSSSLRSSRLGRLRTISLFRDERRGAVDLHDMHADPRLEDVVLVEGPRCPDLAADLHPSAVGVHLLQDDRPRAHECGGARAQPGRHRHVAPSDRPQDRERGDGRHDEHDPLCGQTGARDGHDGGQDRKSTRLNSSHTVISYAVFCLKKKKKKQKHEYQSNNKKKTKKQN